MSGRLICFVVALILAGQAAADESAFKPEPLCSPKNWNEVETWRDWASHTPPSNVAAWPAEARRFANNRDVWRWNDRLFIAWQGGNVVTLSDCPFTDAMYFHLYERYDEAGEFHVVRTQYYEDRLYTLVMRRTGRLFTIGGPPIWSPDKARFAWGVCDLMNGKDDLAIARSVDGTLEVETEIKIPCGLGDCRIAWESPTALTATCPESGEQGNERKTLRLTLSGGVWRAAPGAR